MFNLQRVLALVHALQRGEYDRLREAVQDRWHQPARAALVPLLREALALEDPDVLGAFLSGAGPSVALLARGDSAHVGRPLGVDVRARRRRRRRSARSVWTIMASRVARRPRTGEPYEVRRRVDVSPLWCHVSAGGALGVQRLPRSARSLVRLRRGAKGDQPRADRVAAALALALPSSCCRSRSREPASIRASHRSCARRGWPRSSASPSCTSRTTRSTIRRSPTRIAWCRWRPRGPSSSGSRCLAARRPAISPAASRRTPRASGCRATSSSRTTSSRQRCSARRSTARTSSPSKATTTT